jgi:hypothetical protein
MEEKNNPAQPDFVQQSLERVFSWRGSSPPPQKEEGSTNSEEKMTSSAEHRDGLREIRSMIIAALPFPPMPIMVCRELGGECRWVFFLSFCVMQFAKLPLQVR